MKDEQISEKDQKKQQLLKDAQELINTAENQIDEAFDDDEIDEENEHSGHTHIHHHDHEHNHGKDDDDEDFDDDEDEDEDDCDGEEHSGHSHHEDDTCDECGHHGHHHEDGCCCGHSHGHSHEHGDGDEEEEEELSIKALIFAGIFFILAELLENLPFTKWIPSLSMSLPGIKVPLNELLMIVFCFIAYIIPGKSVLLGAVKNIIHGEFLDEAFLMTVSSLGAIAVGEYPEAAAIMILYQVGEKFEDYAVDKSRSTITEISKLRPDKALIKAADGTTMEMPAEKVPVGSIIIVKAGDRIPIDGKITVGETYLDTSALTGESVPRHVKAGEEVLSGSINKQGVIEVCTTKKAGDSALSRILELVENATDHKTKSEQFVSRFAKVYTPIVVAAAVVLAVIPCVFIGAKTGDWSWSSNWSIWFHRALMFLVVSCPCAIVISIPLSFCGGITVCARNGILIKGSTFLEALAKTKIAVFDKTGTLTKGNFIVTDIHPMNPKITKQELIAAATHAELLSTHPISASLRAAHHANCCDQVKLENVEDITSKGIKATVNGKTVLAGNNKLMEMFNIDYPDCPEHQDGTIIHVACDGEYAGHIVISDEIKEDSQATIADLKKAGVQNVVMLTGDNERTAKTVAERLGVHKVYGQMMSADKLTKVEELLKTLEKPNGKKKGTLIFTGDGINDAPVLARADAGIAMGTMGSDAAVEAGDIVIMEDKPSKIVDGIKVSKKTLRIVHENLIGALGIKGAILILSALGISNMWLAVFGDVGVTILAVLNSLRLLGIKKIK